MFSINLLGLQVCRGYPLLFDLGDEVITADAYEDVQRNGVPQWPELFPSHLKSDLISIRIVKGDMGFGFTIADSKYGQTVKKILDRSRCKNLMEGDILCEINHIDVRKMSHAEIVDVLRDCPVGREATVSIQRGGTISRNFIQQNATTQPVSHSFIYHLAHLYIFISLMFVILSPPSHQNLKIADQSVIIQALTLVSCEPNLAID